jgi:uncharacterized protein (TIGR03086 family)
MGDAGVMNDTTDTTAVSTETAADRFRRLADRFATIVAAVPSDRWEAPSPCEGWTVAEVVDHIVTTERDFLLRMDVVPDPPAVPEIAGDDPPLATAADWAPIRSIIQVALDDPAIADHTYDGYFGPTTIAQTLDMFYAMDLMVHGWDIARGAGLADLEPFDPDDMARCIAGYETLGDTVRMAGIFGPAIDVPADASDQDRFLAWTGRTP